MNEKIVIIGGTSGIGYATAKAAINEGKDVIIGGRKRDKLASALNGLPGAKGFCVDAESKDSLNSFFEQIGSFDHLVLTHSGNKGFGMFRDLSPEDILTGFKEKVAAQIRAAQCSLNTLRKDGSITFITASSAQSSGPGISGYAAINGALERMVPPLARELAPLRINAVSPGIVDTSWWSFIGDLKDEIFSQSKKSLPVGKIAQAEDIASVILMVLNNSIITGTTILADSGGHLI